MTTAITASTQIHSTSRFTKSGYFSINGIKIRVCRTDNMRDIVNRINNVTSRTGVKAKITVGGDIIFTSRNNKPIKITDKQGVLFGCNNKASINIPSLRSLCNYDNVKYIKNTSPLKKGNNISDNLLQKLNQMKECSEEEQVKLSKCWLNVCCSIEHYVNNNIKSYIADMRDYYNAEAKRLSNTNEEVKPHIYTINAKEERIMNILEIYTVCYSEKELQETTSSILA